MDNTETGKQIPFLKAKAERMARDAGKTLKLVGRAGEEAKRAYGK